MGMGKKKQPVRWYFNIMADNGCIDGFNHGESWSSMAKALAAASHQPASTMGAHANVTLD